MLHSKISLHNIRVYAYHGCLSEEAVIGGNYTVDVDLQVDFTRAATEDDLAKTVDYVQVSEIVHREMAVRSKLIEAVCHRIYDSLRSEFHTVSNVWVRVTKHNAPIPGQVGSVSVEFGER